MDASSVFWPHHHARTSAADAYTSKTIPVISHLSCALNERHHEQKAMSFVAGRMHVLAFQFEVLLTDLVLLQRSESPHDLVQLLHVPGPAHPMSDPGIANRARGSWRTAPHDFEHFFQLLDLPSPTHTHTHVSPHSQLIPQTTRHSVSTCWRPSTQLLRLEQTAQQHSTTSLPRHQGCHRQRTRINIHADRISVADAGTIAIAHHRHMPTDSSHLLGSLLSRQQIQVLLSLSSILEPNFHTLSPRPVLIWRRGHSP